MPDASWGGLEGAVITTVEALGEPSHLSDVQVAFNEHYAAQCGFCTPGMLLAATALIKRKGARSSGRRWSRPWAATTAAAPAM